MENSNKNKHKDYSYPWTVKRTPEGLQAHFKITKHDKQDFWPQKAFINQKNEHQHILSIDTDFCEAKISHVSFESFLNVSTILLDTSSLLKSHAYFYFYSYFSDIRTSISPFSLGTKRIRERFNIKRNILSVSPDLYAGVPLHRPIYWSRLDVSSYLTPYILLTGCSAICEHR